MKQLFSFLLFFVVYNQLYAQKDSVVSLDIVVLSDVKLKEFSAGYQVEKISDSVIKTQSSLTNLLNYNTLVYFKENGAGMISSPSFRGTNASQTAVVWNGININSQLTGQTDFNNVSITNYNSIDVRSGGGSVQYGSGAIGGTVHLNNSFHFYNHFTNQYRVLYGSFNTINTSYKLNVGKERSFVSVGLDYKKSDNDYGYLGYDETNQNGEYEFGGFSLNAGYFLKESLLLKLFHNSSKNNRNLSGTVNYTAHDAYEDVNAKTMLVLDILGAKFSSSINVAHLYEDYKYITNNENTNLYSYGKVNTFIAKYDASLNLKASNILLKGILEYDGVKGEGTDIGYNKRETFSAVLLMNQTVSNKFDYGINLRTEYNNQYNVPFLFSLGGNYKVLDFYTLKFSGSKNYRIPTFNDLYWVPGGNPNLKPENSYQVELGNNFQFNTQQITFTGFYIKSDDMIKWQPVNGTIWSPVNIAEAESYGIEFKYTITKSYGNNHFNFIGNYGYTISQNTPTGKQLIYVPKNKVTAALAYDYKQFSAYYQFLYTGSVYTTTDNSTILNSYDISDIGINYHLLFNKKVDAEIGFTIQNLYNEKYQNVAYRPMPNRNYSIKLILNF